VRLDLVIDVGLVESIAEEVRQSSDIGDSPIGRLRRNPVEGAEEPVEGGVVHVDALGEVPRDKCLL